MSGKLSTSHHSAQIQLESSRTYPECLTNTLCIFQTNLDKYRIIRKPRHIDWDDRRKRTDIWVECILLLTGRYLLCLDLRMISVLENKTWCFIMKVGRRACSDN